MFNQNNIVKCEHCKTEDTHITNITDTVNVGDYPPLSYGYRQGAITIELTCENCGGKTFVVCGEHKGNVYLNVTKEPPKVNN